MYTHEFITLAAGTLLSLLFSYIPKLNVWYNAMTAEVKRLVMLGMLLIISAAVFLLAFYGVIEIEGWGDLQSNIVLFVKTFVMALIANQSTYLITPQTEAVRMIKQQIK